MAKKGKKKRREKLDSITETFTVTLPEGVRLNTSADIVAFEGHIGEVAYWMDPDGRERFQDTTDEQANAIANALISVVALAQGAMVAGGDTLNSAMSSVIANAENGLSLIGNSYEAGCNFVLSGVEEIVEDMADSLCHHS